MRRILVLVATAAAVAWLGGFAAYLARMPSAPTDGSVRTDGIVVLTGPENARLGRGIDLFAEGSSPVLLVSGVVPDMTTARLMRWAHRGETELPPGLVLGRQARSTLGNANETAEWACANRLRSIRVVTADYHMDRSLWLLGLAMPGVALVPDALATGPVTRAGPLLKRLIDYDKGLVQGAMRRLGMLGIVPARCGVA